MAEFEISEVSAVGKDQDLILEVCHWHDDTARGQGRPPDYIEEHQFIGVPEMTPDYELHPKTPGWLRNTAGESVPNWHENANGEWVQGPDPAVVASLVVARTAEEKLLDWLLWHVEERAAIVQERRLEGIDHLPGSIRPRKNNRAQAWGNRAGVQALKGRTRRG